MGSVDIYAHSGLTGLLLLSLEQDTWKHKTVFLPRISEMPMSAGVPVAEELDYKTVNTVSQLSKSTLDLANTSAPLRIGFEALWASAEFFYLTAFRFWTMRFLRKESHRLAKAGDVMLNACLLIG